MSVNMIMAGALWRDLNARGVRHLDLGHCEAMVARMLDCTRAVAARISDDDKPPRRCDTGEVDLDLSCMVCGAVEGETCRQLEGRQ
ncbi:hypothetical protein PMI42_00748 [Bradyrhizobium sp. YR681]|uniref:hypothetical protein n=1 Tax=Bradyrhizobium sp. YR681 TaxID=1144344 RepID=UPI000270E6A8|nr:hypothetical protein [Bradyrhizobium sp. YR681]EJN15730.1 hypothetical protein PMI42_00748 [Bradyrhizobium sp. YR681]